MYTDCEGLMTTSGSPFPNTAVMQLAKAGVDPDKIVIGKPGDASDANNGYMSPAELAGCFKQAKAKGWNAGSASFSSYTAESGR